MLDIMQFESDKLQPGTIVCVHARDIADDVDVYLHIAYMGKYGDKDDCEQVFYVLDPRRYDTPGYVIESGDNLLRVRFVSTFRTRLIRYRLLGEQSCLI